MSKVGFWLKGGNGKLAGATVYKSNGETVMREVDKMSTIYLAFRSLIRTFAE